MKKKEKSLLTYGIIAIIIVVAINQMGYISLFPKFQMGEGPPDDKPSIDSEMRSNYLKGYGKFEVQSHATDSAAPATSRTLATNFNVLWWRYINGKYNKVVTETTGTDYASFGAEDGGYAWIAVEIPSGQAYYVDYQRTMEDPFIVGYQYFDIDADNSEEFVFQYNLKGHSIPSSGYPVLDFYTYLITYDSSFAVSDLANATSIGTSTVTKWYQNYGTVSAESKGIAIYKIEWKVTTTDITKVRLKSMSIPGYGTLQGSAFDVQYTSTEIKYIYSFSNTFDKSHYLIRMPKDIEYLYFNTEVEWTLAGSDDLLVTFTLYQLVAPSEAGISDTDTFYAQA